MQFGITTKTPLINRIKILRDYQDTFDQIEFEIDAVLWIVLSILLSGAVAVFFAVLATEYLLIGIALAVVVVDLMLGYPVLKASERIDKIEENLSDALKQMADTLKAGGTVEFALREVAYSEYGPLKKELMGILRKLEEGENFANALMHLSKNVKSTIVQRTITIIIDSIKAGAGLAEILDQISDDVRETHKIARERKTRTLLQVIFLFAAGGVIAPMIFGFVGTISQLLINSAASVADETVKQQALKAAGTIEFAVQAYLFFQTVAVSAMISLMREGRLTKTIIYFPAILFIAVLAYTGASVLSRSLIGV